MGTIVTLGDGRAFTAAHCLAAADGRRGVVVGNTDRRWRVVKRWSPASDDLALLLAIDTAGDARRQEAGSARLAGRSLVRPGVRVEFMGHSGGRFRRRAAAVIVATPRSATAVVESPAGVCANDSGGPVFVCGVLVGIVTHRTGPPQSALSSRHLVFTRLDSLEMRLRIGRAYRRFVQQIAPRPNTATAADV